MEVNVLVTSLLKAGSRKCYQKLLLSDGGLASSVDLNVPM